MTPQGSTFGITQMGLELAGSLGMVTIVRTEGASFLVPSGAEYPAAD